jgi:hypothetical protein
MNRRLYLIALDWTDPEVRAEELRQAIRATDLFENWWNHIPTVFLVASSATADTIATFIRRFTGSANLLVSEVNLAESEGLLPKKGWHWINRRLQDLSQPAGNEERAG